MTGEDGKNGGEPRRAAIEPEVLEPEGGRGGFTGRSGGSGGGFAGSGRSGRSGQRGEERIIWAYGWPGTAVDRNGCLAPGTTLLIFVICWAEYGFLAALGFMFFHVLFGVIGSVQASRRLMTGRPFNIWLWRAGNWLLSYFLAVWLAGGLRN